MRNIAIFGLAISLMCFSNKKPLKFNKDYVIPLKTDIDFELQNAEVKHLVDTINTNRKEIKLYILKASKYKGYKMNYHKLYRLDVLGDKEIKTFDNSYAMWATIPKEFIKYNAIKNEFLLKLNLGENRDVLILFDEDHYDQWPGILSIIDIGGSSAELIFNNEWFLDKIITMPDGSYKLRLRDWDYEFGETCPMDENHNVCPTYPDVVSIRYVYIKNNELVVEDPHLHVSEILKFSNFEEDWQKKGWDSYNKKDSDDYEVFTTRIGKKTIKLYNGHGFGKEDKLGDFCKVKIIDENGVESEFISRYRWKKIKDRFKKYNLIENPYFLCLDLGEGHIFIVLFYGFLANDAVAYSTLIDLYGAKPTSMSPSVWYLIGIIKNNKSYKLRFTYLKNYESVCKKVAEDSESVSVRECSDGSTIYFVKDLYIKNGKLVEEGVKMYYRDIKKMMEEKF